MGNTDVFRRERLLQRTFAGKRQHIGGHAYGCALGQVGSQPFGVGGNLAAFLQTDAGAGKLVFGLLPIAAVHPHAGIVGSYGQCAHRAGKARQIAPRLPVFG